MRVRLQSQINLCSVRLHQIQIKPLLASKIIIQGRRGYSRRIHDFPHRGGGVSLLGKQYERGVEDSPAGFRFQMVVCCLSVFYSHFFILDFRLDVFYLTLATEAIPAYYIGKYPHLSMIIR